jgi:hypothetical protein
MSNLHDVQFPVRARQSDYDPEIMIVLDNEFFTVVNCLDQRMFEGHTPISLKLLTTATNVCDLKDFCRNCYARNCTLLHSEWLEAVAALTKCGCREDIEAVTTITDALGIKMETT